MWLFSILISIAFAEPNLVHIDRGPPKEFAHLSSKEMFGLWSKLKTTRASKQKIFGNYNWGCLVGASALSAKGAGFEQVVLERNHFYGHSDLIRFISGLGNQISSMRLGTMYIADLGLPQGGPFSSGHVSHQNGLDVDIRYYRDNRVVVSGDHVNANWVKEFSQWLKIAAENPRLERIFINPVIKREMCKIFPVATNKTWLLKLRPWWGHDEHFHARLSCPASERDCVAQEAIDKSEDTCGEKLNWWFSAAAKAEYDKMMEKSKERQERGFPSLPTACYSLLK